MSLADYYRRTVDLNDSQLGGWASIYYGVFSKVIEENNYKTVAEVGIGYGTHAKYILKNNLALERLYLIDPMVFYPNDNFARDIMNCNAVIPGNNFNELYDHIQEELRPFGDRHTMFRVKSLDVTNEQIAEGALDAVFLDGDHSYAAVTADLEFWWKKIRSGGQLVGDDYWISSVEQAVTEFAQKHSLSYDFLYRPGTTYKIYRFHKA